MKTRTRVALLGAVALTIATGCEAVVVDRINQTRTAAGVAALPTTAYLNDAAGQHSVDMCAARQVTATPNPTAAYGLETTTGVVEVVDAEPLDPAITDPAARNADATDAMWARWEDNPGIVDPGWSALGVGEHECEDGRLYMTAVAAPPADHARLGPVLHRRLHRRPDPGRDRPAVRHGGELAGPDRRPAARPAPAARRRRGRPAGGGRHPRRRVHRWQPHADDEPGPRLRPARVRRRHDQLPPAPGCHDAPRDHGGGHRRHRRRHGGRPLAQVQRRHLPPRRRAHRPPRLVGRWRRRHGRCGGRGPDARRPARERRPAARGGRVDRRQPHGRPRPDRDGPRRRPVPAVQLRAGHRRAARARGTSRTRGARRPTPAGRSATSSSCPARATPSRSRRAAPAGPGRSARSSGTTSTCRRVGPGSADRAALRSALSWPTASPT